MNIRNILAIAGAGLMMATPLAANATTLAKAGTAPVSNPCKGLTGKALKECRAKQLHTTSTQTPKPKA